MDRMERSNVVGHIRNKQGDPHERQSLYNTPPRTAGILQWKHIIDTKGLNRVRKQQQGMKKNTSIDPSKPQPKWRAKPMKIRIPGSPSHLSVT